MKRLAWIPWRWWRRAVQFAMFLLFLWLFRRTAYTGEDQLAGGENIFFLLDPLASSAAMLAARQFISMFWPAAILVLLTLVLGRFFCGWICPLGTLLDYFHRLLRPITRRTNRLFEPCIKNELSSGLTTDKRPTTAVVGKSKTLQLPLPAIAVAGRLHNINAYLRSTRYVLLIVVLLAAVFSYSLVGLVDPFALLFRGMTFWGDPALFNGVDAGMGWLDGRWGSDAIGRFIENHHLLPFRATAFKLAGVSAAILGVIFALELVARRFWCRYLCPLGAMLGLLGRWSLAKRLPAGTCKNCGDCATLCRMDALGDGISPENCTLCMDCVDLCPKGIAKFTFKRSRSKPNDLLTKGATAGLSSSASDTPRKNTAGQASSGTRRTRQVDLSRRGVLVGLAVGAAIPGVAAAVQAVRPRETDPYLLRPPGAGDEKTFLDLCIRCGECMKVCPTGVLQPAVLESGVEGIFSPRLLPRFVFEQTYCEYSCTLCCQVCPTGAIPRLTEESKHERPIGWAYFDHARCLPWGKQTPCIRCEEMCPAPEKAIKILKTYTVTGEDGFEQEIHLPYVDRDLCVGCGICESNCPVEGQSAIRVRRLDAPNPGTEIMLEQKPS